MKIEVKSQVFELEELWKQRQTALQREEDSLREYEKMADDQREALEDIIDQALSKMREDKSWLPYSLEVREGSAIDVSLRILFSDISNEIIKRRDQERRQISEAQIQTEAMIQELERPEEEDEEVEA